MKKRTWPCEHIKWSVGEYSGGHFRFRAYTEGMIKQQHYVITDNWQVCPICSAQRPRRRKK